MSFATIVAVIGLVFSMISIRLMSTIEKAQVIVVNRVDESSNRVRNSQMLHRAVTKKFIAFTISSRKLAFLKIGATVFAKLSSIIFVVESMYPERAIEGAAFAMMKTVVISNRVFATVRNGKYVIERIKKNDSSKSDGHADRM